LLVGAVSNPVSDVDQADFVLIIGANPSSNHPVAATWMKNAAQCGTRIVLVDPRRSDLTRLRHRRARHDSAGHGREPTHSRHRQRALPTSDPARIRGAAPLSWRLAPTTACSVAWCSSRLPKSRPQPTC
jgi:hypothetical protein